MDHFMSSIRKQLTKFEAILQDDIDEFNTKLNCTRMTLSDYIDQQIEYLKTAKKKYTDEFDYLERENTDTCQINRHEFDKLCISINQNDQNATKVTDLLHNFEQTFPVRPKMLKDIPEYSFHEINLDDLIKKQDNRLRSSPVLVNEDNHAFLPINDHQIIPSGSMGRSHHKEFAQQNNEEPPIPDSRLTSTCSIMSGPDAMIDLLFQIPYQHQRAPCLIACNDDENYLLIYPIHSRKFEYLCFRSRQFSTIDLPFDESILSLGYYKIQQLFYLSTRITNRFVLFRLDQQQQQIEIVREIDLINQKDHFIGVHMCGDVVFFLYLSSSIVMFGKYDLKASSFLPSISFEHKLYDVDEKSTFKIIDFAINHSYISFLIQLHNKNKSMIIIYDCETMNKLHSFDLIDATKPLSIVSTEKRSNSTHTTMSDDEIELLLFINDPKSHLIHCCTHQQYLIPIQVNAFGICPLNDGNLSLIASRDIRGLKVQDHLRRNNV